MTAVPTSEEGPGAGDGRDIAAHQGASGSWTVSAASRRVSLARGNGVQAEGAEGIELSIRSGPGYTGSHGHLTGRGANEAYRQRVAASQASQEEQPAVMTALDPCL